MNEKTPKEGCGSGMGDAELLARAIIGSSADSDFPWSHRDATTQRWHQKNGRMVLDELERRASERGEPLSFSG